MAQKIGLISLGCAKNLVNSEQMLFLLREAGMDITAAPENADATIINTCGFIDSAKSEAIDTILELAQAKSDGTLGKIIVTGCLAQRYSDELLAELPEVDALVGVGSFDEIVSVVRSVLDGERVSAFGDINAPDYEVGRVFTTSPVWEYIKIAEGCDNRCAYCAIPDIRGHFRSRPMENIIAEAKDMAAHGIKELIIIAQDITRYGTDNYGKRSLAPLLRELCRIDGFEWIRLHYLYPDEIDDELIEVIASEPKILKYLDIPIQHIATGILKTMCRRGTGDEIRTLFKKLRNRIPNLVIRTSLITGLPGEGAAEFDELCTFLRVAKIERAGVFPYSPEEGTPAFSMERPDPEIAQARADAVMAIQADIMDNFNKSRENSLVPVLVEGREGDYYFGRSYAESPDIDGYVWFTAQTAEIGTFVQVRITGTLDGEPSGYLAQNKLEEADT